MAPIKFFHQNAGVCSCPDTKKPPSLVGKAASISQHKFSKIRMKT